MRNFRLGYDYDPLLDMRARKRKRYEPPPPYLLPQWKREAGGHKAANKTRARMAKRRDNNASHRERREEAERRLADTLRRVVQALEMGIAELKEIGLPVVSFQKSVNQHQLHNAIVFLKTKCGVNFGSGDNEYSQKTKLDRVHLHEGYETEYERRKRIEREEAELDL